MTTGTALPLHWCYTDPFEQSYDGDEVITVDNRQPGFQVWESPARVVWLAASGEDADGTYSADEYPTLLVVEASDAYDGVGEWLAVEPGDVLSVRAISTADVIAWAGAQAGDDDALEEWLSDHEADVAAFLTTAPAVEVAWVETLPEE